MEISIQNLIDDARCFKTVLDLRWPEKVFCPHCNSDNIIKRGKDESEIHKQRYTAPTLICECVARRLCMCFALIYTALACAFSQTNVVAGHKGNQKSVRQKKSSSRNITRKIAVVFRIF